MISGFTEACKFLQKQPIYATNDSFANHYTKTLLVLNMLFIPNKAPMRWDGVMKFKILSLRTL